MTDCSDADDAVLAEAEPSFEVPDLVPLTGPPFSGEPFASVARHCMKRALGLAICTPAGLRYEADQSLQVASGLSVLPVRVCSSTSPDARQAIEPHAATNFASRTCEVYVPC